MSKQRSTWVPDEDLVNHGDGEIPEDADFFEPPPREIGEILSAHTTLREHVEPWSIGLRAFWFMAAVGIGAAVGIVLGVVIDLHIVARVALVIGLVLLGATLAWYFTRFSHTCSYVGRDGIARFRCGGDRHRIVKEELFEFQDATELRTGQTRHYTNGIYQGTNYNFNWTDRDGRRVFSLSGRYHNEQGSPPAKDPYHFAVAAEMAWSNYLLETMVPRRLDKKKPIDFNLERGDYVSVGEGWVELCVRGDTVHCDSDDIAKVTIDQGVFTVKRTDAKEGWFTSKGVFKFNYNSLANAQLFQLVFDKLVGVRIR